MAWALEFGGSGEHLTMSQIGLSGDFEINIRLKLDSIDSDCFVAGRASSSNDWVGFYLGKFQARLSRTFVILPVSPQVGVWYDIKIERIGTLITISETALGSGSANDSEVVYFDQLGKFSTNATETFYGQLEFISFASASANHNYDATASNHGTGQPVVVDTIGNNDATGFGFPTDGSAWVDLGGGGSTDYPTTLESGSITYSGSSINATQVINTTIASGSLSLTGQPISNPIAFNSVLQSGDIALNGQSIQATQQINTLLDSGTMLLTGSPMLFGQVTETVLGTGELTLIGDTLTTTVNSGIILETGQLTLNGQPITVTSSNDVIQTIQNVTVNYAPNLITTKYAQDTITARYKD